MRCSSGSTWTATCAYASRLWPPPWADDAAEQHAEVPVVEPEAQEDQGATGERLGDGWGDAVAEGDRVERRSGGAPVRTRL